MRSRRITTCWKPRQRRRGFRLLRCAVQSGNRVTNTLTNLYLRVPLYGTSFPGALRAKLLHIFPRAIASSFRLTRSPHNAHPTCASTLFYLPHHHLCAVPAQWLRRGRFKLKQWRHDNSSIADDHIRQRFLCAQHSTGRANQPMHSEGSRYRQFQFRSYLVGKWRPGGQLNDRHGFVIGILYSTSYRAHSIHSERHRNQQSGRNEIGLCIGRRRRHNRELDSSGCGRVWWNGHAP